MTSENYKEVCDNAVEFLLKGDLGKFDYLQKRLETHKVGTIQTIINKAEMQEMETEGDRFNRAFHEAEHGGGDDEEEEKEIIF